MPLSSRSALTASAAVALVALAVAPTAQALPTSCTVYGPAVKIRAGETREMLVTCTTATGQRVAVQVVTPFTTLTSTSKGERNGAAVFDVTAPAGFTGPDTIRVQGTDADGTGGLTDKTLTVRAASENDAPACQVRTPNIETDAGTRTAAVLQCADPDIDALTVEVAGAPAHGTVALLPPAPIIEPPTYAEYVPAAGYAGPDTFSLRARDALGAVSPAYPINVTVRAPAPSAPAPTTPSITASVLRIPRLGAALRRGFDVGVTASVDGTARVRLTVAGTAARRLGITRGATIASGSRAVRAGRRARVTLTFTPAAKRKLRKVTRLNATLVVNVAGAAASRPLTLRR